MTLTGKNPTTVIMDEFGTTLLRTALTAVLKEAVGQTAPEEHFGFIDLWGPVIDRILGLGALMPEHELLGLISAHVTEMDAIGWHMPTLTRLRALLA